MDIKITKEKGSNVLARVEVPAARMTELFDAAYATLAPTISIAGFRPGKAPRTMIIESIGRQRLANGAMEEALRLAYRQLIKEHKITPLGNPTVKILQQPSFLEGGDNKLVFEIAVGVMPEVKITKDYKAIELTRPEKDHDVVTDQELDDALEHLRRRNATLKKVARAAKKGDRVEISFEGSDAQRVLIEQLTSKNHPVILGQNTLIPGFEDRILGMKAGNKKEFKLRFPKGHFAAQFSGKEFNFKVEMHDVSEVVLPKLDDKFAKKVGVPSVDGLRDKMRENLVAEKRRRQLSVTADEIANALIAMTRVEVPSVLTGSEAKRLSDNVVENAKRQGQTLEQYLEKLKLTREKFDEGITKQAARNIIIGLALREIAQKEKIEIGKEESLDKVLRWLIDINTKERKNSITNS